jgi:hypothetical protein
MRRRYDDGKPTRRTEVANDQGPTALSLSGHLFNPQYLLTSDDFTSFRLWVFFKFQILLLGCSHKENLLFPSHRKP